MEPWQIWLGPPRPRYSLAESSLMALAGAAFPLAPPGLDIASHALPLQPDAFCWRMVVAGLARAASRERCARPGSSAKNALLGAR